MQFSFCTLFFFFPPACLVPLGLGIETWVWNIVKLFPASCACCFFNLEFPLVPSLLHYFIFFLQFSVWRSLPQGHLWQPRWDQAILLGVPWLPAVLIAYVFIPIHRSCALSSSLTRAYAPEGKQQSLPCPLLCLQPVAHCCRVHTLVFLQ